MQIRAYLDNNATSRPLTEAVEAMKFYQESMYLNASSTSGELLGAGQPLKDARMTMLSLLGGTQDSDRIVLTSGATEANTWSIFGALLPGSHIVTSELEHSSILAATKIARERGHCVEYAKADMHGRVNRESLIKVIRPDTRLVSIQLANNETGVIQDLAEIISEVRAHAPEAIFHTDATQAVGRIPIDLSGLLEGVDLLSFSAHKFHGPKGIGGLFIRDGVVLAPLIAGEQEWGLRGGTSNVPAAAGLAVAGRQAADSIGLMRAVGALRDRLEAAICAMRPDAMVNGLSSIRLPNTSSITLPGIEAENVVERLALQGICLATGSACAAGASAPSHVLTAMGLSANHARSTLRISLSIKTTAGEIQNAMDALRPLIVNAALKLRA